MTQPAPAFTNRLAQETSPYLRQHMHNPVQWYAWGEEAFAAAREGDRPILLSVGYSTCHWCHVMAHESFENEATAAYMNAQFVNVKLDREERPDIDGLYMSAVQAMTGSGGWPMTVFLTPELRPFYAGTYFPPRDMQGMPSFRRVMESVANAWTGERAKLESNAEALTAHIREASAAPAQPDGWPDDLLPRALENLSQLHDPVNGGFGRAPKFPSPTTLQFLLTQPQGQAMALHSLKAMLRGGICDQLGGGFHRYSVDGGWRVPHFEKMLYDNAQLVRVLLSGYTISRDAELLNGALGTLEYLEREMLSPEGGFYSAQDADSNHIEGLTFVWTPREFRDVLADDADEMMAVFGVSESGNFSDPHHPEFGRRSVPYLPTGVAPEQTERVEAARRKLHTARASRIQPGTDDKVLTGWNGLMLAALADAARVTGDGHWLELARRNRDFVRANLTAPDGSLLHTYKDGQAKIGRLLEDHSLYALGWWRCTGRAATWATCAGRSSSGKSFGAITGTTGQACSTPRHAARRCCSPSGPSSSTPPCSAATPPPRSSRSGSPGILATKRPRPSPAAPCRPTRVSCSRPPPGWAACCSQRRICCRPRPRWPCWATNRPASPSSGNWRAMNCPSR